MLLCQFLGLNLKRHEISISCLLEHSFLEPSLHALRKPKHLCGKAHMQRTVPGLLLTPSSAMWISCVGVGFPSFSRTSQLPLCASETILPAESCSPYRFRSKINDCHCFKLLNFEVVLYAAIDIQDNWHLLFFYAFSLLPQEAVVIMLQPFRQGPCQNFPNPECPCMCLPSAFLWQCCSLECRLCLPSASSFTQCCLLSFGAHWLTSVFGVRRQK